MHNTTHTRHHAQHSPLRPDVTAHADTTATTTARQQHSNTPTARTPSAKTAEDNRAGNPLPAPDFSHGRGCEKSRVHMRLISRSGAVWGQWGRYRQEKGHIQMEHRLGAVTGPLANGVVTDNPVQDPRAVLDAALPEGWAWDERELILLGILERQAWHINALEEALAADRYIVLTSRGEPKMHPAITELRLAYAAMARTAEAIRLPEIDGESSNKSVRHQRAARRRWDRAVG